MNWNKWCKTEEFNNMVGEELTKILKKKGFDQAETLDLLKRAVALAETNGNVYAMLKAFEYLSKMHGIDKPAGVKTTKQLEAKKISGYLEDANKEEELIEFRQTQTEVTTDVKQPENEVKEVVYEQVD